MERDTFKDDPADTVATRLNGRTSAPLVINRNGSRKDLFGGRQQQTNKTSTSSHARSGSASLSPDQKHSSPGSRIARLNSNSPRLYGIGVAYRMADVEVEDQKEAAQGSPSPAPRTWRSKPDGGGTGDTSPSENQGSRRRPAVGRLSTAQPSRRGTASSADTLGADKHGGNDSDDDFDQKIKQFGKEQQHREGASEESISGGSNGLFAKSRLGPKVAETGKELSRKASNGSLDETAPTTGYRPWGLKAGNAAGFLKRTLSSPAKRDDNPGALPSVHVATRSEPTPNKSFAWDADADFTEGDLLVSDSPPVKTGRPDSPPTYRNTRIDEIRARELEAALKYPYDPPESADDSDSSNRRKSGSAEPVRPLGRTNTKLDEIRAREIESLSKRAVATARLDEIRERNAEARSRSTSPEIPRKSSRDLLQETPLLDDRPAKTYSGALPEDRAQKSNTPATTLREPSPEFIKGDAREEERRAGSRSASQSTQRDPIARVDSHDLLRRLARAASTSPAPEQQNPKRDVADLPGPSGEPEKDTLPRKARKERNAASDKAPKAVGFSGLRHQSSSESLSDPTKSKRSSLALSDSDPTERIEREMQLFAPGDNHSDRAPSPFDSGMEDDDIEETPRPVRIDPLSQPTPKVTGAYVETPATVKPERPEDSSLLPTIVEPTQEGATTDSLPIGGSRGRKVEISLRKPLQTSSAERQGEAGRAKSQSRTFQRSKSLPRARSPLINSVRPPTVRDDLLEIQRTYQIEDSTLDDLDGMFAQDMAADDLEFEPVKVEITDAQDLLTSQNNQIKHIDRTVASIHAAKRGIERLEDEVSKATKADHKPTVPKAEMADPQHDTYSDPKSAVTKTEMADPHHTTHPDHASSCESCLAHPPGNSIKYIHLPVPVLYRRDPHLKLTSLGIITCILLLLPAWLIAESTMCAFYCKPSVCYPGKPCVWSPSDPFWGSAIPVKLDQWTTGGRGRTLMQQIQPEVADWWADVWDYVTGTDIRTVDTRGFDWERRRQHRRRLRKKGLVKPRPFVESAEDRERYGTWKRARIAREEALARRREMGYPDDYDDGREETFAADERVR